MDKQNFEVRAYIKRRVRKAVAISALCRIRKIVDQVEAADRKARIAVYIFALLFTTLAIALFLMISQSQH